MKNKKKIVVLVVIIFIVLMIGIGSLITNKNNNPKTIEEILEINFDDISYVEVDFSAYKRERWDSQEFKDMYKDKLYVKYKGGPGSTAHSYFVCYDKNDSVLCTLVGIGNRNLIYLKKGEFDINNLEDTFFLQEK